MSPPTLRLMFFRIPTRADAVKSRRQIIDPTDIALQFGTRKKTHGTCGPPMGSSNKNARATR